MLGDFNSGADAASRSSSHGSGTDRSEPSFVLPLSPSFPWLAQPATAAVNFTAVEADHDKNVLAQKAGVERAAAGEQARLSAITRVKEAASAPARNR